MKTFLILLSCLLLLGCSSNQVVGVKADQLILVVPEELLEPSKDLYTLDGWFKENEPKEESKQ